MDDITKPQVSHINISYKENNNNNNIREKVYWETHTHGLDKTGLEWTVNYVDYDEVEGMIKRRREDE